MNARTFAGALLVTATLLAIEPACAGDAERGRELYEARCAGCHSIEANRVGPMHRGVFGRKAGAVADFSYSPALKNASVVWDEATLQRWLTNPSALIPGTRMAFRVALPEDRADIVAFLKKESGK